MKAMDSRKRAIETFRAKAKLHVNEYKRDLFRLEDQLKKVRAPSSSSGLHGAFLEPPPSPLRSLWCWCTGGAAGEGVQVPRRHGDERME